MKQRKTPLRTCCVTREQFPKKELIRIVRNKDMEVSVDITGKANGRGAYIKSDLEVLKMAKNKKVLERQLECQIPDQIYEELERLITLNGQSS